jgi:hypothetical protein
MPTPRIGMFWSRGNPGALPFEVEDEWSDFRVHHRGVSGEYRRPMDPERITVPGLSAIGWRPVGERGSVIGRVSTEQQSLEGSPLVSIRAYGSSPFSGSDSTRADVRDARTRLEGAGGWRVGRFGLGVTAGYEAHEHRTTATGLPRWGRSAAPAVGAGVAAELTGRLKVGAYGRWSGFAETTQMVVVSREGMAFEINGLREPARYGIFVSSPYFLRIEHGAHAGGINASGGHGALTWTGFVESTGMRQTRWIDRTRDSPPKDEWSTDGWSAGLAIQRPVGGVMWTVDARWSMLDGAGRTAQAEDTEFEAEESALGGSLDGYWDGGGTPLSVAVRATLHYRASDRVDPVAELSSNIQSLTPGIAAAVGFRPADRTMLTGGLGTWRHATRGEVPALASEGPIFRRVIAPEVALLASPASAWTVHLGVGHELRSGLFLWARAERESVAPQDAVRAVPLLPTGNRVAHGIAFGISMKP